MKSLPNQDGADESCPSNGEGERGVAGETGVVLETGVAVETGVPGERKGMNCFPNDVPPP